MFNNKLIFAESLKIVQLRGLLKILNSNQEMYTELSSLSLLELLGQVKSLDEVTTLHVYISVLYSIMDNCENLSEKIGDLIMQCTNLFYISDVFSF